jgi:two-component system response regulator RegA
MNPVDRILLVDDDEVFRERLARALRSLGSEVVTAADPVAAFEAAEAMAPTAAILDLKLGGASGLDALDRLVVRHPGIRIILLTGYGSIATAIEAVRKGAWDYLTKPADAEQILAALNAEPGERQAMRRIQPPSLERLEWEHIQRVLHDHDGNISHAAEALGLHRRSLQRKLQKYPPQA